MTPLGLRLKYIPLYRDYYLSVLSRDILLYRLVIRSSLTSIAHYPTVYIKKGLLIGAVQTRCAAYRDTQPNSQCNACQGYVLHLAGLITHIGG